jgi:hypothetical protein
MYVPVSAEPKSWVNRFHSALPRKPGNGATPTGSARNADDENEAAAAVVDWLGAKAAATGAMINDTSRAAVAFIMVVVLVSW